jgi:hypothetical protein
MILVQASARMTPARHQVIKSQPPFDGRPQPPSFYLYYALFHINNLPRNDDQVMSQILPKGTLNRGRSGFAMIDPETELYHHKLGRAQHVAISYVWSEWQNELGSGLPNWSLLRARLLELVGRSASNFMKILTGHRVNCWLDSKCIDQSSGEDKAY